MWSHTTCVGRECVSIALSSSSSSSSSSSWNEREDILARHKSRDQKPQNEDMFSSNFFFKLGCGGMALRSSSSSSSSSSPSSCSFICQNRSIRRARNRDFMACSILLPRLIIPSPDSKSYQRNAQGKLLCFSAAGKHKEWSRDCLFPPSMRQKYNYCSGSNIIPVRAFSSLVSTNKSSSTSTSPSITWGIIPQKSEGRKKVIEYLESQGITNTEELKGIELPNTVEVMEERVSFLKKLGLTIEAINNYPLMVTCSIKKNLIPVLDYLENLGFRSRDLPSFLERYPMVLHSSVVIDLIPTVDYLLGLDIQRKDVHRVLLRYPDILGFRLEGTMSTSVAYLISIGVRARCIGRMLTEFPEILGMRVANMIKPKVDFIVSYGVPKSIVARILEVRPYILGFDFDDTMKPTVDCLVKAGVNKEGISRIITQYPDILGRDIRKQLSEKTKWLVGEIKISPCNVPRVIEKLPQVLFIKEDLAMERVDYLIDSGCCRDDVAKMVTECPQLLALSIGQAIDPSLKFLTRDMKRSIEEIVKFPSYFTYDLKSRIMPRHKMIALRGIDCSLEWFLNCSDQKFKERLEADYIEDDDNDDEGESDHVFRMGGAIYIDEEDEKVDAKVDVSTSALEINDEFNTASDFDDEEMDFWDDDDDDDEEEETQR